MSTIIPLLNDKRTDLSNEMLVQMGLVMELFTAGQMICYNCARTFDNCNYKDTFFQKQKQAVGELYTAMRRAITLIDKAFDGTLQKIWSKFPQQSGSAYDSFQRASMETLRMVLIMNSRADGDPEKLRKMQKALLNFKPDEHFEFDLNNMLKYYDLDK